MTKILNFIIFFFFPLLIITTHFLNLANWILPTEITIWALSMIIYVNKRLVQLKAYLESGPDFKALSDTYLKELKMAKTVQQGLLSVESPQLKGISVAKQCISADTVGGDFYTFVNKDISTIEEKSQSLPGVVSLTDKQERFLGIAIGDVAGHGISSALVMSLCSVLLRAIGKNHRSPSKTLERVNNELIKYLRQSHNIYVTVFYSMLYLDSKKFVYSKAGHPPILLSHKDGEVDELNTEGVILGMFEKEEYEEETVQLKKGDKLVFYTDGITEIRNPEGEEFGRDRLKTLISENNAETPDNLQSIVFDTIQDFSEKAPLRDDQTLVVISVDK